jgi:hypothetical protein
VPDQNFRPGSSGVFKAIVESAKKLKRAVTGGDDQLSAAAEELGTAIAQAFVTNRFADVHAMGTKGFQARTPRDTFASGWADSIRDRGPLTGFEISNAGQLEVGYIPGLEEVSQSDFAGFLELVFSSPNIALDDDRAFTIGAVLLHEDGQVRLGALHMG